MTGRREKIDCLTGLRFIAAAMIVVHHSRGVLGIPDSFLPGISLQTGVSFFFVLSGFILAYVYPELSDRGSVRRFFVARIARIWPAHFFALCLAVALQIDAANPGPGIAIANAAMIHAWVPATGWFFSFNAVSWSISTEFFFYLAFPFLIAGFRETWRWKLALGAALVVGILLACEFFNVRPYAGAGPFEVNRAGLIYISPLARLFEFILGMVTAKFWLACTSPEKPALSSATMKEIAAIALCAGAVVLFSSKKLLATWFGTGAAAYLGHAGPGPAFAVLIFIFASQNGAISRALSRPAAVLLGEISFSVYLLHQIMLRWIDMHRPDFAAFSEPMLYAGFWIVLLFASWLVWRFIERPARRAILRIGSPA